MIWVFSLIGFKFVLVAKKEKGEAVKGVKSCWGDFGDNGVVSATSLSCCSWSTELGIMMHGSRQGRSDLG